MDPVAVLRSRAYLSALVLAAILGIPISAAAYGFLALVTNSQELHLLRPAGRPLLGWGTRLVAGAVARPVWTPDRRDDPLPAGERGTLTRIGFQVGGSPVDRELPGSFSRRWPR